MTTPFDSSYWDDEADTLYQELLPIMLTILASGMDGGIEALPNNIQPLVNPTMFNQAAFNYAQQYRYNQIKGITDTTRQQVQSTLAEWIKSGQSLDVLEQQISVIFGDARAAAIAATEVTRIFAEANALAWKSTGFVDKVRFNTAEDDRVCPYCSPLDGNEYDVDDYGHKPPIHVNCRCFNTPVVDVDAVGQQLDQILGL